MHGTLTIESTGTLDIYGSVMIESDATYSPLGTVTIETGGALYRVPSVSGISPASGPADGGTIVTITGIGFTGTTAVFFGSTTATSFTVDSDTQITAVDPAEEAGTVDISVTGLLGTSAQSANDQFTFNASPTIAGISPISGPLAGGTVVTLTGTNFFGTVSVTIGGVSATNVQVNSAGTQITAVTPASATAGSANVVITSSTNGSVTADGAFTYIATPTITSISPNSGLLGGGTVVTISGTNLAGATAVDFGSNTATTYTINSATQITATAPPGTAGTIDVTVTTAGGTSATSSSDQFTYAALVVTNTSNNETIVGSLPWCVALANTDTSNADITFDPADFPTATSIILASTLALSNTAHSITIDGSGAGPVTISGGGTVEVFEVNAAVSAALSNLTITGGHGANGGGVNNGGGADHRQLHH